MTGFWGVVVYEAVTLFVDSIFGGLEKWVTVGCIWWNACGSICHFVSVLMHQRI